MTDDNLASDSGSQTIGLGDAVEDRDGYVGRHSRNPQGFDDGDDQPVWLADAGAAEMNSLLTHLAASGPEGQASGPGHGGHGGHGGGGHREGFVVQIADTAAAPLPVRQRGASLVGRTF